MEFSRKERQRKKTGGKKSDKKGQNVPPKEETEKFEDKENKQDSSIEEVKDEGIIGKRTEEENESESINEKVENKEDSRKKKG